MVVKTFVFLTVLLTLSGCQTMAAKKWTSQELLLPDQASVESLAFPKEISSRQVAEDIDFLVYTLSHAYGGRQYVPGDTFSNALAALRRIANVTSVAQFHEQIDDVLFTIPDNHLQAVYKGNVGKKRREYRELSKGHVGKNNIKNPEQVWETRFERIGKRKVLYISIMRFPAAENEIWKGFISSVSSKMKSSDAIVIDLRGNSGGDDTVGMELAQVLYGHPFEHPIKRQYRSQTPETLALFTNRLNVDIINLKYRGEKVPDYLVSEFNDSKEKYNSALKGEIPPEFIRTDKGLRSRLDPGAGYKKPIYILMDKSCGSSCEFTMAAFEWHNHVKRVGENTNGTFHFSNAGTAFLPHSKIRVWIPTQYSEYFDRRFVERTGFVPDIPVPSGDDAYLAVKKILGAR